MSDIINSFCPNPILGLRDFYRFDGCFPLAVRNVGNSVSYSYRSNEIEMKLQVMTPIEV